MTGCLDTGEPVEFEKWPVEAMIGKNRPLGYGWTGGVWEITNSSYERGEPAAYGPPSFAGVDRQWTVSTGTGCNQWLSLAKPTLKVLPARRNRSLVARTS